MSIIRALTRGMRVLLHRDAADRDLDEEVGSFFAEEEASLVARGFAPEEAHRMARLNLGSTPMARDEVRAHGWEHFVGTVLSDTRYALRRMRTNPAFTTVSVLTLALGIGASTAIFSAVHPILFSPLPYPHASRIVTISDRNKDGGPMDVTFGTYVEMAERTHAFEAIAAFKPWQATLTGGATPERLDGQRVGASFFRALGVKPAIGRDFDAAEDVVNGPDVVVLTDGIWRTRYGADPNIVGKRVRLNDSEFTVIGVMPRDFESVLAPSAQLWAPLQYDRSLPGFDGREWGHHLRMIARLRTDDGAAEATREIAAVAQHPIAGITRPQWADMKQGMLMSSMQDDVTRGVRPALFAIIGAVLLLLAIACVNVTNLLLARSTQRRGEFAMRTALGGGRARLMQQLLTESLILAGAGGALGLLVARAGIGAVVALSPPGLPRVSAIHLDPAVFLFAFAVTTLIGLLVGLAPALQMSRGDLHGALARGSRRTAGERQTARRFLVIAEVAFALILLVNAGLLLRSLERLFGVRVGFDSSHVLTMRVVESSARFDSDTVRYQFLQQSLEQVRRVPGVIDAAFTSQLPLSGDQDIYGMNFEKDHDPNNFNPALRYAVTPDYFRAMNIPLVHGRMLGDRDVAGAPLVVVISDAFAKRVFRGADPIGERLKIGAGDSPWYTIVGTVGDVKQASLGADDADAAYVTPPQWHFVDNVMSLVVRTRGDAAAAAPSVKRAVWSVDKDQPIIRIASMDKLVAASEASRHFVLVLFEFFALAALTLAGIGIYGLLSGSVTERMREIGVRSALGASRGEVVGLVLGQGMKLTMIGVLIGLGGAIAASRALVTMLFGITRLDLTTYAGVVIVLASVSAVACALPAFRAARVDPSVTLRAE